jgi:hypothetical protein
MEVIFWRIIVIGFLTIITLGFYYPWAKRRLQYLYGETSLEGDALHFMALEKKCLKVFIVLFIPGILAYVIVDLSEIGYLRLFYFMRDFAILPTFSTTVLTAIECQELPEGDRFGYRGDRSELIQNSSSGFSYNYYHGNLWSLDGNQFT